MDSEKLGAIANILFGDMVPKGKKRGKRPEELFSEDENRDLSGSFTEKDLLQSSQDHGFFNKSRAFDRVFGNNQIPDNSMKEQDYYQIFMNNIGNNQKEMSSGAIWSPKNQPYLGSDNGAGSGGDSSAMTGVRKSSFYDIPNPTKVVVVVENTLSGTGHSGVVFEDAEGNTLGYHFGAWPTEEDKHDSWHGPGRIIVETNAYSRYEEHGGIKFVLNMTPEQARRTKHFFDKLDQSGTRMERENDLYGDIQRKSEISDPSFSTYDIGGRDGGKNCVNNVMAGIIFGFGPDSSQARELVKWGGLSSFSPYDFAERLEGQGQDLDIIKDCTATISYRARAIW